MELSNQGRDLISIEASDISDTGLLIIPEGVVEISSNCIPSTIREKITRITFPQSLQRIGANAFQKCAISQLDLPNNLHLGFGCFTSCLKLKTITLGTDTTIEANAFYGCGQLQKIRGLNKAKTISGFAFANCINLSLTAVGQEVIESCVYSGCKRLRQVTINDTVREIKQSSFSECINLFSLSLPNIESIHPEAFFVCKNLFLIHIQSDDKQQIQAMKKKFERCKLTDDKKLQLMVVGDTTYKKIQAIKEQAYNEIVYHLFNQSRLPGDDSPRIPFELCQLMYNDYGIGDSKKLLTMNDVLNSVIRLVLKNKPIEDDISEQVVEELKLKIHLHKEQCMRRLSVAHELTKLRAQLIKESLKQASHPEQAYNGLTKKQCAALLQLIHYVEGSREKLKLGDAEKKYLVSNDKVCHLLTSYKLMGVIKQIESEISDKDAATTVSQSAKA